MLQYLMATFMEIEVAPRTRAEKIFRLKSAQAADAAEESSVLTRDSELFIFQFSKYGRGLKFVFRNGEERNGQPFIQLVKE